MVDVRFEGSVYPAGLGVTVRKHRVLKVQDVDLDYAMRFDLEITDGNVTIDCEIDGQYEYSKHYGRLYTRACDVANAAVNLVAFAMGVGATVVIHSFIEANGRRCGIVLRDRQLSALCTAFSPDDERFDETIAIIHADLRISRAIRDLTEAIGGPHLIPSMCARAMETLRVVIVPRGFDRKQGWALMQQRLNLSMEYIKAITDYGVAPRHGDHEFVSAGATRMIATRSWIIMNRFLEYKKRGSSPLPISDFPLLTG